MSPKANGHSARVAASSPDDDSPKSSLTDRSAAADDDDDDDDGPPASAAALLLGADSDVDLPRNSHVEVRASPCCGSLFVAAWSGAVPKTCVSSLSAFLPS